MAAKLDESPVVYPTLEINGKDDLNHEFSSQSNRNNPSVLLRKDDPSSSSTSSAPASNVTLASSSFANGGVKMELDGSSNPKIDSSSLPFQHTFSTAFSQNPLTSPFTTPSYPSATTNYTTAIFQSPTDLFDPTKAAMATLSHNASARSALEQTGQKQVSQDPKSSLATGAQSTTTTGAQTNTTNTANGNAAQTPGGSNFAYDERFHILYEREVKWGEVKKYSEYIQRFACEASHMELTKESYYDLYNMALCLLKSVDGLDPDKLNRKAPGEQQPQYSFITSQMAQVNPGAIVPTNNPLNAVPQQNNSMNDMDMMRRKGPNYDFFVNRQNNAFDQTTYLSAIPKYAIPTTPTDTQMYYNAPATDGVAVGMGAYAVPLGTPSTPFQGTSSYGIKTDPLKPKNFTGEVFFDDLNQGDDRRPKRRRRRTVYSSRRNLHCHMCGVTETPEWRRGPAGDHTLCNACGLHYAKSLKKQRKERDARKHSIDMLLNESQTQVSATQPTAPATSPVPTSPGGITPAPTPPSETSPA